MEMQEKYGESNVSKASDEEKAAITKTVQMVRYSATKAYIQYKAIVPNIKIKEDEDIERQYQTIKEEFIIKRSELESFVINFNKILVNHVIETLLETSQALVDDIYKNAES